MASSTPGEARPLLPAAGHGGKQNEACGGRFGRVAWLLVLAAVLVALSVANSVLNAVMLFYYGVKYVTFVNQFTVTVYVLLSWLAVAYRRFWSRALTEQGMAVPKWHLVAIGLMNAGGNFIGAVGAVHTSGVTQNLVSQVTIPVTMAASAGFLRKRYSRGALSGAALILGGALLAVLPSLLKSSGGGSSADGQQFYIGSSLLYFAATCMWALAFVYEEWALKDYDTDVIFLFAWVLTVQFVAGWALAPLQALPSLGNIPLASLPSVLRDGWLCFLGQAAPQPGLPACSSANTVVLLAFAAVNYSLAWLALVVIKRGSASLNAIAAGISLPVTNIVYALPFIMGRFTEPFSWLSLAALLAVVAGFVLYQRHSADEFGQQREGSAVTAVER
eukprot:PLAT10703.1.p1 GENE.PLAT10703.1~~PLAT10703.1.p1  ORF type:complete len:389 (+),score=123.16 PLAT10703.1:25-1191(+)